MKSGQIIYVTSISIKKMPLILILAFDFVFICYTIRLGRENIVIIQKHLSWRCVNLSSQCETQE